MEEKEVKTPGGEKKSRIRIMNKEEQSREARRKLTSYLRSAGTVALSVALSFLLIRYVPPLKNENPPEAANVRTAIQAVPEDKYRSIYENKFRYFPGAAVKPEDFKYNDHDLTSGAVAVDGQGDFLIPSRLIKNNEKKVYLRVTDEPDDRFHEATVIGTDEITRMTLVNCPTLIFQPPEFIPQEEIILADSVIVIASPFGKRDYINIDFSFIHSKNMVYTLKDSMGRESKVSTMISASPIYTGNDGGLVLDSTGRPVGITSMYLTDSLGFKRYTAVVGKSEIEKIISRITRSTRGFKMEMGTEGRIMYYEPASSYVYYVLSVSSDSAAQKGGLLPTDMIVTADGKAITENTDINSILEGKKVGDSVTLEVFRKNEMKKIIMKIY